MDGGRRLLRQIKERGFAGGFGLASAQHRRRWRSGRSRVTESASQLVDATPHGLGGFLATVLVGLSFSYGIVRGGHAEAFLAAYGDPFHAVGRSMGFEVQHITMSGLGDLTQNDVLKSSGLAVGQALPFIDIDAVRDRLLAVPMIKDVEIRKNYPHGLAIHVTEREGFALWQNHGALSVIAPDGAVIDKFRGDVPAGVPLVVGEGANKRAAALFKMLEAQPDLKSRVTAATLVGSRRWTLRLDRGIEARLPEDGEAEALARLSALIKEQKLLDRAILAVDLRMPDRVVLRLTEEALAERLETQKKLSKVKGSTT
jgi:cell division protein FtsQ